MSSLSAESPKNPMPRLQFVQSNPRTRPVPWSWSTWNADHFPPGDVDSQIAQAPPCEASRASYSSIVSRYLESNRPFLAPPVAANRRVASRIFSGFLEAQVIAGLVPHSLQHVEKIVLLFFFRLKALTGSRRRHFLHSFMEPFYA